MTIAALIALAKIYGTKAVVWVIANANWLLPLGLAAFEVIRQRFG